MHLKRNLHKAAINGTLEQAPKELLTYENLTALDNQGDTVFHKSASKGTLDKLPKELVTEKNFLVKNTSGWTTFDVAAMYGYLDQIPEHLLTPKVMLNGYSTLHLAAGEGHLNQLPRRLLTEENLLIPINVSEDNPTLAGNAHIGQTALQRAAIHGHLEQLLGIELSEKVRHIVGPDWYSKNRHICEEMRKSKGELAEWDPAQEIELF